MEAGASGQVLMEVRLAAGEPLALVHDHDDMLTIQRGGQILPGCFWRESELEKAVWEFREISRELKGEQNHPRHATS